MPDESGAEDTGEIEQELGEHQISQLSSGEELTDAELIDQLSPDTTRHDDASSPNSPESGAELVEVEEILERQYEELHEEFQHKIEDLRKRVIQVKREIDTKAPQDHHHAELEELETTVDSHESQLDRLDDRLEQQTDALNAAIDTKTEQLDEVSSRLELLGQAVIDLQETVGSLRQTRNHHNRLRTLLDTANTQNIEEAECSACEEKVLLGLLRDPTCPNCDALFRELDQNTGIFSTHQLLIDDRPVLEETPTNAMEDSAGPNAGERDG